MVRILFYSVAGILVGVMFGMVLMATIDQQGALSLRQVFTIIGACGAVAVVPAAVFAEWMNRRGSQILEHRETNSVKNNQMGFIGVYRTPLSWSKFGKILRDLGKIKNP